MTGPESSGKTTLCKTLSEHFKISFTEEYARKYLNNLDREYKEEDLLEIAKGQFQSENNSQLLDTDLITIKIWSGYKYEKCDKWILNQIEKQKSEKRVYLLCKPNIPWKADPLRENSEDRNELFKMYRTELLNLKHPFFLIVGLGNNRPKNAIKIVEEIMLDK